MVLMYNRTLMLVGRIIKLNTIVNLPGTESKARFKLLSIIILINEDYGQLGR